MACDDPLNDHNCKFNFNVTSTLRIKVMTYTMYKGPSYRKHTNESNISGSMAKTRRTIGAHVAALMAPFPAKNKS